MPGTWPDTFNEAPNGVRTVFTLVSGLTPVNQTVFIAGIKIENSDYVISGSQFTFGFAPQTNDPMDCYHWPTGVGGPPAGSPGVTTLGVVRNSVRARADMVNSTFCTDAELNSYINASYYELYDILIQKYGNDYYVTTPYSFTTDGTNELFALPATFYKALGVEVQINGSPTNWRTLQKFPFVERNKLSVPGGQAAYGIRTRLRYRINGNNLWLKPLPIAGQVIQIWFVPRLNILVNDGDTLDGISGWEEYVITDCVIKAKTKEESDPSVEMAMKQALLQRIEAAAENRDAGSPEVVGDARGLMRSYEFGDNEWDN